MGDTQKLVLYGGPVKSLGGGAVGGYLVFYGSPTDSDLEGDFFTADTDFAIETGDRLPVYYHHGFDGTIKTRRIGRGIVRFDDVGVWIEAQLDLRDQYVQAIMELVEQGALGWSSGAVSHLVVRDEQEPRHFKSWPLGEASLTPTPAEPRNVVTMVRAVDDGVITEHDDDEGSSQEARPEALPSAARAGDAVDTHGSDNNAGPVAPVMTDEEHNHEEDSMDDELKAVGQRLDELSARIDGILTALESSPSAVRAGYVTNDGGAADRDVRSLADYLLAIRRGDHRRLVEVYGSHKDLATTDGSAGGYLVPEEFSTALLRVAETQSPILSRVQVVPVGTIAGTYPALDRYVTPTAGSGQVAAAAGVKATATEEGAALTETEPSFVELNWRVKKLGGYTEVSNELAAASMATIETLLRQLFAIAIAQVKERHILRGNGASEYLGILNSPAAIGITPDTNNVFAYEDMLEMWSRFKAVGGQPVWLAHPSIIPDLGVFEIGTTGAGVPSGVGTGVLSTMPGNPYPIVFSEHLPQADSAGCVILADLSAYLVFQYGTLRIAYSEHAAFTSDKGTWRFTDLSDGMPWVKGPVTLADPQGSYTVSPFVYFND